MSYSLRHGTGQASVDAWPTLSFGDQLKPVVSTPGLHLMSLRRVHLLRDFREGVTYLYVVGAWWGVAAVVRYLEQQFHFCLE